MARSVSFRKECSCEISQVSDSKHFSHPCHHNRSNVAPRMAIGIERAVKLNGRSLHDGGSHSRNFKEDTNDELNTNGRRKKS